MVGVGIALVVAGVLAAVTWAVLHTQLVANRNHCDEAWANVGTELQRRHDLIPNLVETVSGFAASERRALTELTTEVVTVLAAVDDRVDPSSDHAEDENRLEGLLAQLLARVEQHPELAADAHFRGLQRELIDTADRMQRALRFYNGNIRIYNNNVGQFPSSLVARTGGHRTRDYFHIDDRLTGQRIRFGNS